MASPTSPNFHFLAAHDDLLLALGAQAERYFADDPSTCLIKLRQFGEVLAQRAAANVDERLVFQRHITHIKPSRLLNQAYLTSALNSPHTLSRAHTVARGNAQKTVTLGDLRRFPIPIAPAAEQEQIAKVLNQVFESIQALQDIVAGTQERTLQIEAACLSKAFCGELVPQDPNDEPASVLLERIRAERAAQEKAEPKRSRAGRRPSSGRTLRPQEQSE